MKRNPSRQRQSIRQADPATKRMTAAWKDSLKRKCIERARQKRNNQIAQKRFSRLPADTIESSRDSNDEQGENSMMMMMGMESAEETEEARGMTRNLIAEQLHATGLSIVPRPVIRSTSTPHNQMMYEYSTSGKSNRTFGNNGNALQGFGTGATIGCKTNGYPSEGGKGTDEGDYCVTEDEFQALIDEIEAELEDDYEQQMQIFQAEEEENQLMINDQIEAYESFESQNIRETMGAQDIVNCPLCHAGLLRMDPSTPGDFFCELVGNTTPDIQCCKFATGARFGVHMSLSELKSRLMMAYVKHTTMCTGSLQFDLSGVGLVAGCSKCMKTEIIAPAQPVRRS